MPTAITFALQALQAIPSLIAAGQSVVELVNHTSASLKAMQDEKRDPTDSEWKELNDRIAALRSELHSD